MVEVKFDEKLSAPLTYRITEWIYKRQVVMRCAKGHIATLDHEIDDEGYVTPSIVCPHEGCDFHEMVKLLDWNSNFL